MFKTPLSEKQTLYSEVEIARWIRKACQSMKKSEEQLLTNVLKELGYKKPKFERQVPLKLTEGIKTQLNNKVKDITKQIAREIPGTNQRSIRPNIMDRSLAQYIMEYTMLSYGCQIEGRKAKKNDIDSFMGFSERTMREQQKKYKLKIEKSHTVENKLYIKLTFEIENIALLQ